MKIQFRYRRLAAMVAIGLITATALASAAEAGGRYRGGSYSYGNDYRQQSWGYDRNGGPAYRRSEGGWGGNSQCSNHPPHYFFDGRLYCSGKNPDGSWRGPERCEDDCGRKLVDNRQWVEAHQYLRRADACRVDDRRHGGGWNR